MLSLISYWTSSALRRLLKLVCAHLASHLISAPLVHLWRSSHSGLVLFSGARRFGTNSRRSIARRVGAGATRPWFVPPPPAPPYSARSAQVFSPWLDPFDLVVARAGPGRHSINYSCSVAG